MKRQTDGSVVAGWQALLDSCRLFPLGRFANLMPAACRTYKVAGPAAWGRGWESLHPDLSEQSPPAQKLKEHPPAPHLSVDLPATSGIAAGISQQYDRRPGTSGDGCPSPVRCAISRPGMGLSLESAVIAEPAGWNDWRLSAWTAPLQYK